MRDHNKEHVLRNIYRSISYNLVMLEKLLGVEVGGSGWHKAGSIFIMLVQKNKKAMKYKGKSFRFVVNLCRKVPLLHLFDTEPLTSPGV